ncbi:PfkB family carbohydrate kinase [Thalassobaculum sp.]|uniref:PfkB family carbohydrate kinase n=1 Tax=Thalassobaculum sp. TaxID=2022740 RepID=UPI0032EEB9A2
MADTTTTQGDRRAAAAKPPYVQCLGAATLDTVLRVPAIPPHGKVLADACAVFGAGMASAAAASIARLGGRAGIWARIGNDEAGARWLADIGGEGVDVSAVRVVPGRRTAISTIVVDSAGERLIVPFYDPELSRDPAWLPLASLAAAGAVLADTRWPEGAAAMLDAARAAGVPAILDADTADPDVLRDLAARADHVVCSEPGLALLEPSGDLAALAVRLPAARVLAVTLGADGVRWIADGVAGRQPGFPVVAVDTLSAGDVFHGAYALGVAEGRGASESMRFAAAAAAIKVTRFGGRLGAPTRDEVDAMLIGDAG